MAEGREGKIMTSEWIEVVNDDDIMYLNNMYDDFEDALIDIMDSFFLICCYMWYILLNCNI